MSATKHRLGRDPELHQIHDSIAEADRYIGKPGEITLVRESPVTPLVQMRCHDGLVPGGYVTTLVAANSVAALAPDAKALPGIVIPLGNEPTNIMHGLGYNPSIEVVAEDGGYSVMYMVQYVDNMNIALSTLEGGTFTVFLR